MTLSAGDGRRAEAAGRDPELLRPADAAACGERERDELGDESEYGSSDELTGGDDDTTDDDDDGAPCDGAGDSNTWRRSCWSRRVTVRCRQLTSGLTRSSHGMPRMAS
jgi:hypothetical protein